MRSSIGPEGKFEGPRHPCEEEHGRRKHHHHGAKTFRRGRAIEFLNRLNIKRNTLKQQLATPELQSINPVIVGELKAIEMVISEFTELFEIREEEIREKEAGAEEKEKPEDEEKEG
ncbi:hypothetical protein [Heyndrickxia coagulans]|mgnify:CR=1 FL=1|uniref:hypothetical protein n=1 Tax=Heyndrickxia coagulans TaxID=1398 RepID=UPI002E1D6728|nr:hypothetical protein [Heyndrickxia coagulans]